MVQVVHSSDLSTKSFAVVDGKLEVVPNEDNTIAYQKAAGAAGFNPVRILWSDGADITFEDLRAQHAAALAAEPDMTYFEMISNGYAQALVKNKADGGWDITQFMSTAGTTGLLYPEAQVTNKAGAPLFIDKKGNPVDSARTVYKYNLQPEFYLNLSEGAEATFECVTPQKLRNLELVTAVRANGYVNPILKGLIEYADGTTDTQYVMPYNNNWYMGDVIDQTKRISKVTLTMDSSYTGFPAMQKSQMWLDTATGITYSDADLPAAAAFTPVVSVFYLNGYVNPNMTQKFYDLVADNADITAMCDVKANLASATVAANTAIPVLIDGDDATVFTTTATSNSLTFTVTPVAGQRFNKLKTVRVDLHVPAGTEGVVKSITGAVVTTSFGTRNGNATANTRHFRIEDADIVGGKVSLLCSAAFPNAYPETIEKLVVALTKTTAGAWNVSGVKVNGSMK